MNTRCEVIRDLLPLYVDGVASKESCALIEEHLKDCADCREYLKLLQEDLPDISEAAFADEAASLKKIKSKMLRNRIMIVLVTLAFAVIAGAVLHSQHLAEYSGSLDENLSYELPAGYELMESSTESNIENKIYVRETAETRETITLYYEGMYTSEESYFSEDKIIPIDKSTEVRISRYDWDNSFDNSMNFLILHDDEAYTIEYQCAETNKNHYYDSCSKEQEDEIVAFIKTFEFHRPDGSDKNVFQRLYHNYGTSGMVVLILSVLFFVGVPIAIAVSGFSGFNSKDDETVITSKDLHNSMNRERKAKGEAVLPSVNNVQGVSSNNLARRDHSWSSVPDFFIKLFRKK